MFVRDRMTSNVFTVGEETNVLEALDIMRRHGVRRLPVVRGQQLVGIVTQLELYRVAPSPATTLSVFELNHLLSRMTVKEAMTRDVVTTSPGATVEEAALLMRDRRIGGLPVVDDGKVVGIITETNLLDSFIDLMGLKKAGIRLTLEVDDKVGTLADVAEAIRDMGINILSLATFTPSTPGRGGVVVRLATGDVSVLKAKLESHGYKVTHTAVL